MYKVLILFLVLVGIFLFFFFTNNKSKNLRDIPNTPSFTTTDGGEVDTYYNQELGFSFSYPEKYGEINYGVSSGFVDGVSAVSDEFGYVMRGYINNIPFFYFASKTPNYKADRGGDAGESSFETMKNIGVEMTTNTGTVFYYKTYDNSGYHRNVRVAVFKFPEPRQGFESIGFASSIEISEDEFLSVVKSFKFQK